ncbi:MAG: molecular chaperone DnaJ [Trueperaceae bacterium]|nr:molecular chaperone DnaJ [Trueperaceae bacterium]
MPTDYYDLLGVARDADTKAIKAAYRKLALKYHPDRNPGDPDAEETFKSLNEAYAVLSDDEKRANYDRYGTAEPGGMPFGGGAGGGDIFDIFNSVFGGGFAGGGRPQRGRPGEDLEARLEVTLEQARDGATLEVELERMAACDVCHGDRAEPGSDGKEACPTCGGAGQVRSQVQSLLGTMMTTQVCPRCQGEGQVVTHPCSGCSGRGRTLSHDTVEVTLPVGIDGGYRLRIPGQGSAGVDGGPDGDLYVYIELAPHEHFTREGDDLRYALQVGPAQAALGVTVEVPTLDGVDTLEVPAGTQPGTEVRLRGKGMPRLRRGGFGDEIVTVQVVIPKHLTPAAREHLEAYADEVGEEVRETHSLIERLKGVFAGRRHREDGASD